MSLFLSLHTANSPPAPTQMTDTKKENTKRKRVKKVQSDSDSDFSTKDVLEGTQSDDTPIKQRAGRRKQAKYVFDNESESD